MRKTIVAVLGLVLAAPAFFLACKRERKTTIAVIPKGNTTIFWQSVHAGAAKAAMENGAEIIWNGPPSETDYTGQLQITDAMIKRRVDAIVLAPIDRKAMVGVVERAARENVPMVIVDSGIDTEHYVARVATDNYNAGRIAADRVGKLVNGKASGSATGCLCRPPIPGRIRWTSALTRTAAARRLRQLQIGTSDTALSATSTMPFPSSIPGRMPLFARCWADGRRMPQ